MIKVTDKVIKECATNLMFEITDEELKVTLTEFDAILKQMSFLGSIKGVDNAESLTFPTQEINTYLRDDIPTTPLDVKEELKNAPSKLGNQIKLPKVVG